MRVLNIPGGQDTGGNGFRTMDAFRRHRPDWDYDLCVSTINYIQYPAGPYRWGDAQHLWNAADVLHLRNNWAIEDRIPGASRKPAIMQHHGTMYRAVHESLLYEAKRRHAPTVVATLDLWLIHPDDTEWLPSPYDLGWLAGYRRPHEGGGVLRVAHAPTDRRIKSTQALLRAVERLQRDGVPVELDLIENATWAECLDRKGRADVYFDQVQLGYGNNAIEAWGMGIPVIAGAADATLNEYERRFGSVPFVEAQEGSIYEALRQLADPAERELWGKRGLDHVHQWHDERRVVEQLVDLYTRAVDAW